MTADKAFISEPIGPKHSAGTRHKTLLDAASISNSLASRVTAIGWRSAIKSLVSFDGLTADDARYRLGQDQQSGDCKMALTASSSELRCTLTTAAIVKGSISPR